MRAIAIVANMHATKLFGLHIRHNLQILVMIVMCAFDDQEIEMYFLKIRSLQSHQFTTFQINDPHIHMGDVQRSKDVLHRDTLYHG